MTISTGGSVGRKRVAYIGVVVAHRRIYGSGSKEFLQQVVNDDLSNVSCLNFVRHFVVVTTCLGILDIRSNRSVCVRVWLYRYCGNAPRVLIVAIMCCQVTREDRKVESRLFSSSELRDGGHDREHQRERSVTVESHISVNPEKKHGINKLPGVCAIT